MIVTFGVTSHLEKLVAGLVSEGIATIVVDNRGSHSFSPPDVSIDGHSYPPATSANSCYDHGVVSHGNVGYGTGANIGFTTLRRRVPSLTWVLICNADMQLTPGFRRWIRTLPSSAETNYVYGALEETDPYTHRRLFPSAGTMLTTTVVGHRKALLRYRQQIYPKGAVVVIPCEAFERIGGFDSEFFLYFEETDLFHRMRSVGYRVVFAPDWATVVHEGGAQTAQAFLLTGLELGRSAGIYARKRGRPELLALFAFNYIALLVRDAGLGRFRAAARSFLSLIGLLVGSLTRFEPLVLSWLQVVPLRLRRRLCNSKVPLHG